MGLYAYSGTPPEKCAAAEHPWLDTYLENSSEAMEELPFAPADLSHESLDRVKEAFVAAWAKARSGTQEG